MRETAVGKRKQASALLTEAEAIEQRIANAEKLARQLEDVIGGVVEAICDPVAPAHPAQPSAPSAAGTPSPVAPAAGQTTAAPVRPLVTPTASARPAPILELVTRILANGTMERGALFDAMAKAQEEAGEKPMAKTAFDMFVSRHTRAGILVKIGVGKNQSLAFAKGGTAGSSILPGSISKATGEKRDDGKKSNETGGAGERPF